MKNSFIHAKRISLSLLLLFAAGIAMAQKFEMTGKIRVLEPTTVKVEDIEGKEVFSAAIGMDGEFSSPKIKIEPDIYVVSFGEARQAIYLTNKKVTVKGFYNCRDVEKSSLTFSGIETYQELLKWVPTQAVWAERKVDSLVQGKLQGNMYSALAYLSGMTTYEAHKFLLDCMDEASRKTLSGKWLQHRVDSLYNYTLGVDAYNFSFKDEEGKNVQLSDFRGKVVLVDFWASWCGPCRKEMKNLRTIYQELEGKEVEFISVSLDSKEEDWRKALAEEQLPWVTLWNEEGFVIGNEPNEIQRAYGFYSIPFIVLIDQEGKVVGRDLRGERIKEAIISILEK